MGMESWSLISFVMALGCAWENGADFKGNNEEVVVRSKGSYEAESQCCLSNWSSRREWFLSRSCHYHISLGLPACPASIQTLLSQLLIIQDLTET